MSSSFRDLRVRQESIKVATDVYRAAAEFPKHELYGLAQQMRRAAVSVPSNIAEGKGRRTDREFRQFLFTARGSLMELETQLVIAKELQYLPTTDMDTLQEQASDVGRALSGLIKAVNCSESGLRTADDGKRTTDV
jgi:four helix bundle protein